MVEFAIGSLVFFGVVGALIFLGNILFIKFTLQAAAEDALYYASIQHQYHISTNREPLYQAPWNRFEAARDQAVSDALKVALNAGVKKSDAKAGGTVLQPYFIYSPVIDGKYGYNAKASDVLVLRPGESATYLENGETKVIQHPQVCSTFHKSCTAGRTFLGEEMSELLQDNMIFTQARASVWTPFGAITVKGEAQGYAELVNRSTTGNLPPAPPPTTTTTTTTYSTTTTIRGTTSTTTTTVCSLSTSACFYNYGGLCFNQWYCKCEACGAGS